MFTLQGQSRSSQQKVVCLSLCSHRVSCLEPSSCCGNDEIYDTVFRHKKKTDLTGSWPTRDCPYSMNRALLWQPPKVCGGWCVNELQCCRSCTLAVCLHQLCHQHKEPDKLDARLRIHCGECGSTAMWQGDVRNGRWDSLGGLHELSSGCSYSEINYGYGNGSLFNRIVPP